MVNWISSINKLHICLVQLRAHIHRDFISSNGLLSATTYDTLEALVQSFKEGDVDYILVDMYLPVKRRDLFNGSWFEVAGLLASELYHCAMLQGDTVKLASALKEMIAYDNVQTKFLEDDEPQEEVLNIKCIFLSLITYLVLPSQTIGA